MSKPKRNLLSADLNGATLILSIESGKYFWFDEIGEDVWRRVEEPICMQNLAEELAKVYNAPLETILGHVIAFVNRLAELQLVVVE